MVTQNEKIEFDVLFIGGGPANLAGAIKLMQLARQNNLELEVALIEKGSQIGSHALSGAIMNPIALKELLPDYQKKGYPLETIVKGDGFQFLTNQKNIPIPVIPGEMHNKGYHIISLAKFTRWLGSLAEEMGVNILPGFAGTKVLYGLDGKTVIGVQTGPKGLDKKGKHKSNYEAGFDLMAKITVFGEGARGNLVKDMGARPGIFKKKKMPQIFETGIKEVIQLPEDNFFKTAPYNDIHTLGYPLGLNTPGGGFIYEMADNKASIGLIIGLSYEKPLLDFYDEFIKFKKHPLIAGIIKDGKVLEQGARAVSTGGLFTIPKLFSNGALFAGGSAAMHNAPGLKGIHLSMKSGMLAAQTILRAFQKNDFSEKTLCSYDENFKKSWAFKEIQKGRNFSQALAKKGILKPVYLGAQYFTNGRGIRDSMPLIKDAATLKPLKKEISIKKKNFDKNYFDDILYVNKLTGIYLSKTKHREDQACHLIIKDQAICIDKCYKTYQCPCTKFCPGNVYEIEVNENSRQPRLILNPANCLHCKTCDIKDPYNNILWTCPEGGEGPDYTIL